MMVGKPESGDICWYAARTSLGFGRVLMVTTVCCVCRYETNLRLTESQLLEWDDWRWICSLYGVVYGEVITWRCLGWLVRIYVVMRWAEDAIPADVGEWLNAFIGILALGLNLEDTEQKRSKQIRYAFSVPHFCLQCHSWALTSCNHPFGTSAWIDAYMHICREVSRHCSTEEPCSLLASATTWELDMNLKGILRDSLLALFSPSSLISCGISTNNGVQCC